MFDLNFEKLDRFSFSMKNIALTNLFAAWYMLSHLTSTVPSIDPTLARIYFSEYGMTLDGLSDKDIAELAKEYTKAIHHFFLKCQVQRCENIIDRFGKVGCDPRLPHQISLPPQCKDFFLELLVLNKSTTLENAHTKETQCLDSLLSSMIVNNTFDIKSNKNGMMKGELDKEYNITPEQFSSYTDIIHNAVIDLYRPLGGLDETFEDWGTKFRRVIDYIKSLVFMVTRDVAFNETTIYSQIMDDSSIVDPKVAFKSPFVSLGTQDDLFGMATRCMQKAYYNTTSTEQIQSVVAQYSSLKIEHAICLFHTTNAVLDVSKLPQTRNSDTFKFLCCQEYIAYLDAKMKKEYLGKIQGTPSQVG